MLAQDKAGGVIQANLDLAFGLQLLYSHEDDDLGDRFLRRGLRTLLNSFPHLHIHWNHDFVPMDDLEECEIYARGQYLRNRAYLESLLGSQLDYRSLLRASSDYVAWISSSAKLDPWDEQMEADYLSAVRMALIADARDEARQLLHCELPFDGHTEEYEVLVSLADERTANAGVERLDHYFDWVRDPDLQPSSHMDKEMVRLEMGLLRFKYFMAQNPKVDWRQVIDVISQ